MKSWIKIACITAFVSQIATCSSSNQTINESRPAQTVQKGVQQHVEGKDIVDIPEVYMNKLNGLETVKGKVVHIKD
ncbi:Uncharacterized protein BTT61001_02795 [Bacillus thuringiensis]|uniref:Uncharacterized protein n=1 Tax=Bacillus thuringiensis TaxID=1428 RepID=A0A1C4E0J2_BACTU|nr:Uncharacterized protein BTT61001_02795 [Bacillus thuringiensis]